MSSISTYSADVPNDFPLQRVALVEDGNFAVATRESGYRNIAAAISELIDNAFQADATTVHIFVIEARVNELRELTVGVLDDGMGMDCDELQRAMQFGGTNRFGDRSGLGRFGMGLPNSSVSQAKRFDVYTWSPTRNCFRTYLDVDEIAAGQLRAVPLPEPAVLPHWASRAARSSGTLVAWSRCDRLDHRKASTVAQKLHDPLGRIYRRFLWAGKRLFVNGHAILPRDPLFFDPTSGLGGGTGYGKPLIYKISVPGTDGLTSPVTVRFAELPVGLWHSLPGEAKRLKGIIGSSGVSVLRAGREIDYGWHFMGGKRRENYDDWWRCEVSFEPDLDEMFGVTHSKQGISPNRELKNILTHDIEAVARQLNARVRRSFELVRPEPHNSPTRRADAAEPYLPAIALAPVGPTNSFGPYHYKINVNPLGSSAFFSVNMENGQISVCLNADHPFVSKVYLPLCKEKQSVARAAIEATVLSAARTRLHASSYVQEVSLERFFSDWGDALAAFVGG